MTYNSDMRDITNTDPNFWLEDAVSTTFDMLNIEDEEERLNLLEEFIFLKKVNLYIKQYEKESHE